MRPVHRRYVREFIPAMAAYVVVLILVTWGLRHTDSTLLLMVLPAYSALFGLFAVWARRRYA